MSVTREASGALRRKFISLCPAAATLLYPFLLPAFHAAVGPPGELLSAGRIAAAATLLFTHLYGAVVGRTNHAWRQRHGRQSRLVGRARRRRRDFRDNHVRVVPRAGLGAGGRLLLPPRRDLRIVNHTDPS